MNRNPPLTLVLSAFALLVWISCVQAQTAPLPLGVVQDPVPIGTCPTGQGWDTADGMTCVVAGLAGCPNIQNSGLTYGYAKNASKPYKGTIVLFHGWDGTAPATTASDVTFARDYYATGYEVVMLAWDWDWELTTNPLPPDTPPYGNIQAAACRQATFLNYVHNTPALFTTGAD